MGEQISKQRTDKAEHHPRWKKVLEKGYLQTCLQYRFSLSISAEKNDWSATFVRLTSQTVLNDRISDLQWNVVYCFIKRKVLYYILWSQILLIHWFYVPIFFMFDKVSLCAVKIYTSKVNENWFLSFLQACSLLQWKIKVNVHWQMKCHNNGVILFFTSS